MDMTIKVAIAVCVAILLLAVYGVIDLARFSYQVDYERFVKETVREMVKPGALN